MVAPNIAKANRLMRSPIREVQEFKRQFLEGENLEEARGKHIRDVLRQINEQRRRGEGSVRNKNIRRIYSSIAHPDYGITVFGEVEETRGDTLDIILQFGAVSRLGKPIGTSRRGGKDVQLYRTTGYLNYPEGFVSIKAKTSRDNMTFVLNGVNLGYQFQKKRIGTEMHRLVLEIAERKAEREGKIMFFKSYPGDGGVNYYGKNAYRSLIKQLIKENKDSQDIYLFGFLPVPGPSYALVITKRSCLRKLGLKNAPASLLENDTPEKQNAWLERMNKNKMFPSGG